MWRKMPSCATWGNSSASRSGLLFASYLIACEKDEANGEPEGRFDPALALQGLKRGNAKEEQKDSNVGTEPDIFHINLLQSANLGVDACRADRYRAHSISNLVAISSYRFTAASPNSFSAWRKPSTMASSSD